MELDLRDLRVDIFNKRPVSGWAVAPPAAVRITHAPSGVWVEEFGERSVHRNRAEAMRKMQVVWDMAPELFKQPVSNKVLPEISPQELMRFHMDMMELIADGQRYRQLVARISQLPRYKQTWESTTSLMEQHDGNYYLVTDIQSLIKK